MRSRMKKCKERQKDESARHIVLSVPPIGPSDEPEDGDTSGSSVYLPSYSPRSIVLYRLLCAAKGVTVKTDDVT